MIFSLKIRWTIFILFFLNLPGFLPLAKSDTNNVKTEAERHIDPVDTTIKSTDDGPHIYWRNHDTATVIYCCNDEIISKEISLIEPIHFNGFCYDSSISYRINTEPPQIEPDNYDNVLKILTISDIHGEYEYFVEILTNFGVIDDGLKWIWGDGHLVVLGDVFDRGDKVTECLWLIYNLEREAKQNGGRVHFIIGNHEAMVMQGDLRYVHQKYTEGIVKKSRIKYEDLFGPDMELGRWLRTKNAIIKINDILFVHAGINPETIERGLNITQINEKIRNNLYSRSYKIVLDDELKFLFKGQGPLWYRGFVPDDRDARATPSEVGKILDYFDVGSIVIGHSNQEQVCSFYDNRVYAIDVMFDILLSLQGLFWKDGKFYRVLGSGELEQIK